ncbi:hypothetical protein GQR58_024940 [Nymphon striatum]|nr:hypothetical protein GQR58_024940 [Nymphon striatum]
MEQIYKMVIFGAGLRKPNMERQPIRGSLLDPNIDGIKPSGFYLNDRIEAPHRKSVSGCCSVERNQDVLLYAYANLTTSPVRIGVLPSRKTAPLFEDNHHDNQRRGKIKKRKNPLTSRDLYHHSHTSNYEKD